MDLKELKDLKQQLKLFFYHHSLKNDVSFTVNELFNKSKLVEGLNFEMLLTAQEVYEEISSCNKENLQNAVNSILKKINKGFKSKNRTLIVDASL